MSAPQPRKLKHFDYVPLATDAGISESDLAALERATRTEYGADDMLFELRMLRTCNAIRDHHTTVQQVLAEIRNSETSAA